ncbi:uncharacterized protein BO72DRAFT_500931 [Aspergillus fijiensis CBS 313.89]|uniref:Uncharacterized protein n=1 Tax=Aspergillus fijiensis CBS 313.89 TaxID=1448319 RepID=A0A8G1VTX2_9EURO|nr:uncharacterized protein BO72DRAFT_500931 [Aspergillus fijiensis CBS 313.89]RAK72542.1 hypothetical protein BO72DRAFT_500931 [Aspergillus fijiensis CBS 313.89]
MEALRVSIRLFIRRQQAPGNVKRPVTWWLPVRLLAEGTSNGSSDTRWAGATTAPTDRVLPGVGFWAIILNTASQGMLLLTVLLKLDDVPCPGVPGVIPAVMPMSLVL